MKTEMMRNIYSEIEDKHSDRMQQLISSPNIWVHRWGMLTICMILVAVVWLTRIVRYPETVKSTLTFHFIASTVPVLTEAEAKINLLLVRDGEFVNKGQKLAVASTANGFSSIIAERSGKLRYSGLLYVSQLVAENQQIFSISDENLIDFCGEINIPLTNGYKVAEGHTVVVKLPEKSGYKSESLIGIINYVGTFPKGNSFFAKVDFDPKDLIELETLQFIGDGMTVDAEILVENKSLFDRLLDNVFKNLRFSTK